MGTTWQGCGMHRTMHWVYHGGIEGTRQPSSVFNAYPPLHSSDGHSLPSSSPPPPNPQYFSSSPANPSSPARPSHQHPRPHPSSPSPSPIRFCPSPPLPGYNRQEEAPWRPMVLDSP